jgi:triacylglycerol lipase
VRSLVMVATPNHGTPAAGFFASVLGQKLLEMLSLATVYGLRFGRLPTAVLLKLGALTARLDELVGLENNVLDQLYGQLLADFTPDRRDAILRFFHEVRGDQALLPQITPDAMDVFNASTRDRDTVRYGSVVTWAREPGVGSAIAAGLDPYAQATHAIYSVMYRLSSRMRAVDPSPQHAGALVGAYGELPPASASDGMVPTLSQPWGEVIHATRADHLDVIGHYADPNADPPHFDWLSTGTSFNRDRFYALWGDVARFIAASA